MRHFFSCKTIGLLLLAHVLFITENAYAADMFVNAEESLEWNQKEAFYQARGAAHAYQGEQEIFADDLTAFYDAEKAGRTITIINAVGNVRFSDAAHKGSGSRLNYDVALQDYLLTGPDARIDGPDGRARAQKEIHFQRSQNLVNLYQKAEINLADGRILTGDHITLYLSEEDNINKITAKGSVTVIQASGSRASADEMLYNRNDNNAILLGNVTIFDKDNQLSGDKAEIDFATGVSRMLATKKGGRVSGRFTGTEQ